MDFYTLIILVCSILSVSAWSLPYYPRHVHRGPVRITRFAPQHFRMPIRVAESEEEQVPQRPKRNHHDDYNFDDDDHSSHHDDKGVTGPVHTFVKTDKNANYKWGVRHHVGNKFAS